MGREKEREKKFYLCVITFLLKASQDRERHNYQKRSRGKENTIYLPRAIPRHLLIFQKQQRDLRAVRSLSTPSPYLCPPSPGMGGRLPLLPSALFTAAALDFSFVRRRGILTKTSRNKRRCFARKREYGSRSNGNAIFSSRGAVVASRIDSIAKREATLCIFIYYSRAHDRQRERQR